MHDADTLKNHQHTVDADTLKNSLAKAAESQLSIREKRIEELENQTAKDGSLNLDIQGKYLSDPLSRIQVFLRLYGICIIYLCEAGHGAQLPD